MLHLAGRLYLYIHHLLWSKGTILLSNKRVTTWKEKEYSFSGEVKSGQEAEAWLLGIRKYFQVSYYPGNMKAGVAIFNLNGRASIWWDHLRQVKKINDRKIVWKQSIRNTSLIVIMKVKRENSMSLNWGK